MTRTLGQFIALWLHVAMCLGAGLWVTLADLWAPSWAVLVLIGPVWLHVAIWAMWSGIVIFVAMRATWQEIRYWRDVQAARRAYAERRARHVELRPWPRPRPLPPVT